LEDQKDNVCTARLKLVCKLKSGLTESLEISADFSDDVKRAGFVSISSKFMKAGYVALIQASKMIAEKHGGKLLVNPIHIDTIDTNGLMGGHEVTLSQLIKIAGECDTRKYKPINWLNRSKGCQANEQNY